jgi:xyloglucan-specific endo-beta-1,4-glucanase
MKFIQVIGLSLLFSSTSLASPTKTLKERSTEICGQWDTVATGSYTIYQDLWGEAAATSGSQCTTVDADSPLKWSTAWTWAGGSSDVKSYANAVVTASSQQISSISSIESSWAWSYVSCFSVCLNDADELYVQLYWQ